MSGFATLVAPEEIISVSDLGLNDDEIKGLKERGFVEARSVADDDDIHLYHPKHWRECTRKKDIASADWTYYGVSFKALTDSAERWLEGGA